MNYIDFLIIALLGFAVVRGFIKGLIIEVASILALVLGIWGAIRFSGFVGQRLTDYFDLTTQYLGLIAFVITFIIIVLVIHTIANIIDKLLKAVALGIPLRILGAVFGLLKSALILSIIFVILNTVDERKNFLPRERLDQSLFYHTIADFAPMLFPLIEGGDLLKSFERYKRKPGDATV
jgi:membrane protein required for colicin V production